MADSASSSAVFTGAAAVGKMETPSPRSPKRLHRLWQTGHMRLGIAFRIDGICHINNRSDDYQRGRCPAYLAPTADYSRKRHSCRRRRRSSGRTFSTGLSRTTPRDTPSRLWASVKSTSLPFIFKRQHHRHASQRPQQQTGCATAVGQRLPHLAFQVNRTFCKQR